MVQKIGYNNQTLKLFNIKNMAAVLPCPYPAVEQIGSFGCGETKSGFAETFIVPQWPQHRPLVFLDIETTGGSVGGKHGSRITEIGALRVENGEIVQTMSQLLNPEQSVPAFITRLTGISNDMVARAPLFCEVADELETILDGAIFIAHHVQFDYGFIKQEFARINRQFNMNRLCSVRLDRRLYPEQRRHSLDYVIERLGIKVEHRHRAYDDAEVLYQLFAVEFANDPKRLLHAMQKLLVHCR